MRISPGATWSSTSSSFSTARFISFDDRGCKRLGAACGNTVGQCVTGIDDVFDFLAEVLPRRRQFERAGEQPGDLFFGQRIAFDGCGGQRTLCQIQPVERSALPRVPTWHWRCDRIFAAAAPSAI